MNARTHRRILTVAGLTLVATLAACGATRSPAVTAENSASDRLVAASQPLTVTGAAATSLPDVLIVAKRLPAATPVVKAGQPLEEVLIVARRVPAAGQAAPANEARVAALLD